MKYFPDFEFSEGVYKPCSWLPPVGFNRPRWSIELISIGIKCEDGRKYYAVNESFSIGRCNSWVRDNVLPKLPPRRLPITDMCPVLDKTMTAEEIKRCSFIKNPVYKPVERIAREVYAFVNGIVLTGMDVSYPDTIKADAYFRRYIDNFFAHLYKQGGYESWMQRHDGQREEGLTFARPEFYTYYGAYDWVMLCTLFGAMVNLPKGFPMYSHDLKSMLDQEITKISGNDRDYFDGLLQAVKLREDYPKQKEEHNAMDDAEFNHQLFLFINSFSNEQREEKNFKSGRIPAD